MSRLFTCGWETGTLVEIPVGGVTGVGSEAIVGGRSGTFGYRARIAAGDNTYASAYRSIPIGGNPAELWIRLAAGNWNQGIATTNNGAGGTGDLQGAVVELLDGGTVQVGLGWLNSLVATLVVRRGTTQIAAGGSWNLTAYSVIELYAKIHASAGVVKVWIDSVLVVDFSGNTQGSALAQINEVRLGVIKKNVVGYGAAYLYQMDFDDLAINDVNGTRNNGRIGQGGISAFRPVADIEKNWTPSTGTDNYAMVDDTTPDLDTTYVQAVSSGTRDLYACTSLGGSPNVDVLTVVGLARSVTGAGATLAPVLRSGATVSVGSATSIPTSFTVFSQGWDVDPNTGLPWTAVAVNSLQIGAVVV